MREHKTIENGFTWIPPDERVSRFGGPLPPRKPETRRPILWLARDGQELYFVNASQETLDTVIAETGGCMTADDDVLTVSSESNYQYKNVPPDTAVKIEEYDLIFDSDFLLQVSIIVKSATLGCIEILSPPKKGGVEEMVLLWNTGEKGKYVSIKNYQQAIP